MPVSSTEAAPAEYGLALRVVRPLDFLELIVACRLRVLAILVQ
jgi:hypothetical protein